MAQKAACSFSTSRETWRVCVVETENLRAGLSRVYVSLCVYTSLCMSIFVTLCVSARVGVASLEVFDSLRAAIKGEAQTVQTKALAHLLYIVSHCQSCRTPPAHRLPHYPRDYSCVCLLSSRCCYCVGGQISWSLRCHSNQWFQKSLNSHFSSRSCVWKLLQRSGRWRLTFVFCNVWKLI